MSDYQKEKRERNGAWTSGIVDLSIMTLFIIILFVITISIAATKSVDKFVIVETDLIKEQTQYVFKKINESDYEPMTCYSDTEVLMSPKEMGFLEKLKLDGSKISYKVYLVTNEEFTKDCFEQYVTFHQEWSHFKRFEEKVAFDIYIRGKDGRTFTYKNYQEVELQNKDDYLTRRSFEK